MLIPDEELVAEAQAGDYTALSTLYDRHFTKLYRFIYRHVNHIHDAEDLTSEVMLRTVTQLSTYRRQSLYTTWLYGIARHAIADFWRKHYRVREELIAEYAAPADIVPESDRDPSAQLRYQASSVFDQLPAKYRLVLQHRFIDQQSLAATATAMQTTASTVKVLQHQALKQAAEVAKHIV